MNKFFAGGSFTGGAVSLLIILTFLYPMIQENQQTIDDIQKQTQEISSDMRVLKCELLQRC